MRSLFLGNLAVFAMGCSVSAYAQSLSLLKARFDKVSVLESSASRTVLFKVTTCLADQSQKNIKSFSVSRNGEALPSESPNVGCITFKDSIEHIYYSPEHFSEMKYSITVDGATQDQTIFVNPWDDKFTFGFDAREIRDRSIVNMRGGVPSLQVSDLRLVRTADEGREVALTVLLETKSERTPMIGDKQRKEALRDGFYWLEAELINFNGRAIKADKYLVTVKSGKILTTLMAPRSTERAAKLRARIFPAAEYVRAKGNTSIRDLSARDLIVDEPNLSSPETVLQFSSN